MNKSIDYTRLFQKKETKDPQELELQNSSTDSPQKTLP